MVSYTMATDVKLTGTNIPCWNCQQFTNTREVQTGSHSRWQIVCTCGTRGAFQPSIEDAKRSYLGGVASSIGRARIELSIGGLATDWFDEFVRFLGPHDLEMLVCEHIEKSEEAGFVYVMADLANQEIKIGGTGRMPGSRWSEHPRGLLPIMAIATRNWRTTERLAHDQLSDRRTSREEYFRVSIPVAIQAVLSAGAFDGAGVFECGFANHLDDASGGGLPK